jgi:hypothetical protein
MENVWYEEELSEDDGESWIGLTRRHKSVQEATKYPPAKSALMYRIVKVTETREVVE